MLLHYFRMAFRIDHGVERGEIDNRVKGVVRGKIWLAGRAEPVMLELKGNAWPDLAGCLLTFTNPLKLIADSRLDSLKGLQRGSIGDMTASRKVRVYEVPMEEALAMMEREEKPPERMGNCLYLEWFSEANGRVVIESASYHLAISPPEWRLTPPEEAERAAQAEAGMTEFVERLNKVIETHQRGQKDHEEPWDEYDYEKFLKECDARTDKYGELQDKFGNSEEAKEKIDREMGWDEQDDEYDDGGDRMSVEEMNAITQEAEDAPEAEPDPAREGIDWIRDESGYLKHPLQHRCFESSIKYSRRVEQLGLDRFGDKDLDDFIFEFHTTSVKLAGALNSIAQDRAFVEPAFTVAYLKRALDHLHKAQAGLEAVAPKNLMPTTTIAEARKELFEIREGILRLMDQYRGRGGEI
jgi:hypothetical protein